MQVQRKEQAEEAHIKLARTHSHVMTHTYVTRLIHMCHDSSICRCSGKSKRRRRISNANLRRMTPIPKR